MENKWTKDYIMKRLQEHYEDALKLYPEEQIVGIFLQGSQNYGVAYEDSDVDTKLLILPSLEDLCKGKNPVSSVHIRDNNEHIDIKDIRCLIDLLKGENPSYLEILFTNYYIINPKYQDLFQELKTYRDIIPQASMNRFLKSIKGMANQKYCAMEHRYPTKISVIDKFGYDPKQLHHLIRLADFLTKFLKTYKLSDCYDAGYLAEYLIEIKKGKYSLDEARKYGKKTLTFINNTVITFINQNPQYNQVDNQLFDILEQIQIKLMKTYITNIIKGD